MKMNNWKRIVLGLLMALTLVSAGMPAYAQGTQVTATPEPVAEEVQLDPKTGLPIGAEAGTPSPEPTPTPEPQALTPEGNMELVDDISGEQSRDKDFLVVQSRGGKYFYIIVDRANEGSSSVHFLNQVDEKDLLAIIEDEESAASPSPAPAETCTCVGLCQPGEVNTGCKVCALVLTDCKGVAPAATAAPEPDPEASQEPREEPEKPASGNSLAILAVAALLGGGFVYFKFFKGRAGKNRQNPEDLDEQLEQELNGPASYEEEDGDEYEFEDEPDEPEEPIPASAAQDLSGAYPIAGDEDEEDEE